MARYALLEEGLSDEEYSPPTADNDDDDVDDDDDDDDDDGGADDNKMVALKGGKKKVALKGGKGKTPPPPTHDLVLFRQTRTALYDLALKVCCATTVGLSQLLFALKCLRCSTVRPVVLFAL